VTSSPRIIAIANKKGGSGKTTTAVSLAAVFAERGHRVLLVDLDSQANASNWLGVVDEDISLLEALVGEDDIRKLVRESNTPNVDVIPGNSRLMSADIHLSDEVGSENLLREALERLPDTWDFIMLDCPAHMGMLTYNALTAADEVVIPVEVGFHAINGLKDFTAVVAKVSKRLNPSLRISGILMCRVDPVTNFARDIAQMLRQHYGKLVLGGGIPETVRMREAPSYKEPITKFDPTGKAAVAYRAVADLLEKETT
jgi:chromosome partitioning protein